MLRRFLFLGGGALALLVALAAPGQVQAQRMRGGFPVRMSPPFRGGVMPGFRGGFDSRFNREMFDHRFNGGFFTPSFNGGMFNTRFNRGFFTPSFSPRFGSGFFMPF
jgi:hypothetical protein